MELNEITEIIQKNKISLVTAPNISVKYMVYFSGLLNETKYVRYENQINTFYCPII